MPQDETYFDILGIPEGAGYDRVEEGYQREKRRYAQDPARLRLIDQAYRTLISPYEREKYMQRLKSRPAPSGPGAQQPDQATPAPRRRGTAILGNQDEPIPPTRQPSQSEKPVSSGGRNRTQLTNGRTPEPPPVPSAGNKPGGGRSKTQVMGSGPQPGGRTPETTPQETGGDKSSGAVRRSKTQVMGNEPPAVNRTPEPPPQASTGSGRSKTQVMGNEPPAVSRTPEPSPQVTGGKRSKTGLVGDEARQEAQAPAHEPAVEQPGRRPTEPVSSPTPPKEKTQPEPVVVTPPPPQDWDIEVTYQGGVQNRFAIHEGENLVGRPPKDGPMPVVALPDEQRFISRKHAIIILKGGSIFIQDCGSDNGTYVNGKRLDAGTNYPLKPGDVVTIENRELRLRLAKG